MDKLSVITSREESRRSTEAQPLFTNIACARVMSMQQATGHFTTEIRCQTKSRVSSGVRLRAGCLVVSDQEQDVWSCQTKRRVSDHVRLRAGCLVVSD